MQSEKEQPPNIFRLINELKSTKKNTAGCGKRFLKGFKLEIQEKKHERRKLLLWEAAF